jgi:hypothetical protein
MRRTAVLILALAISPPAIADRPFADPEPPRRLFAAAGIGMGVFTGDDNEGASQAMSLAAHIGIPVARRVHVLVGMDSVTLARYEPDPARYQENLVVSAGVRWAGSDTSRYAVQLGWYGRAGIGFGHVTRRDYTPFAEDSDSGPWGFALGGGLGYRVRGPLGDVAMEIVDQIVFYGGGTRHAIGLNLVLEGFSLRL